MIGRLALALLVALAAPAAGFDVPQPVVERHLTVGDRMTRVSLFDDRVAVVSISEGGTRTAYHQVRLSESEYREILERLQGVEDRARSRRLGDVTLEGTSATIRLSVPGRRMRLIDYSLARYQDPHTADLVALLDGLQHRVAVPPRDVEPDLMSWEPQVGQRVELRTGTTGVVAEVHPSGLIVIEEEGSELSGYVTPETRSTVIRRVLEDGE